MAEKSKHGAAALLILLVNAFLLAYAYTLPELNFGVGKKPIFTVRFIPFDSLFVFPFIEDNARADSILAQLTSGESSSDQKISNDILDTTAVFFNPKTENGYALDNFYEALISESGTKLVRVAHYGDSQIEGDRLTSALRVKFQAKFGGSGTGFIPLDDVTDPISYTRNAQENWVRYTVFNKKISDGNYGLSGMTFTFIHAVVREIKDSTAADEEGESSDPATEDVPVEQPAETTAPPDETPAAVNDSTAPNQTAPKQVKPKVKTQTLYFSNATVSFTLPDAVSYSNATLLYGKVPEDCSFTLSDKENDKVLLQKKLARGNKFTMLALPLSTAVKKFKLEFIAGESPEFYGLSLDSQTGIQFDNYGIRGHSGDGLLLIKPEELRLQAEALNTRFFIFQFGGNAVPYIKGTSGLELIEDTYYELLMHFKRSVPNASILVIGVGDMATSKGGSYQSYSILPKFRDAQRRAALRAGCAFWDLYQVMGGANAIVKWAQQNLAAKDGHFSERGRKIVGDELFKVFMTEFENYRNRKGIRQLP